jgi:GTPase involved in cell partitioning and DNA repair
MGKGMDGHAGKDLIIKVPCGTLVWRLPSGQNPPIERKDEDEDEDEDEKPNFQNQREQTAVDSQCEQRRAGAGN